MILFPLALAAAVQSAPKTPPLPSDPREARYQRCVTLAERDPAAAKIEAGKRRLFRAAMPGAGLRDRAELERRR